MFLVLLWFCCYSMTISALLGSPSPALFIAMMRYSSSFPFGCSTNVVSVIPGKIAPVIQISPLIRHISDKNDNAVNSIHKQDYFAKFVDSVRLSPNSLGVVVVKSSVVMGIFPLFNNWYGYCFVYG